MPEITIIQLSPDQIKALVNDAMQEVVAKAIAANKPAVEQQDNTLMGVGEMCQILNIGRTRFEHYKKELIQAGMFRLGKGNSSFLIRRNDFEKWLKSKQA